jgi:Carboxypeptidase regulatory-like domain/TonB-dependent Receptor Plug Domain
VAYNDAIRFVMAFIPFHSKDFAGTQGKKMSAFTALRCALALIAHAVFALALFPAAQAQSENPFAWPPASLHSLPGYLPSPITSPDFLSSFQSKRSSPAAKPESWLPADPGPIAPPDGVAPLNNPVGLALLENAVGTGILTGEVSDATTLDPISGAVVEIIGSGRTAETDAKGRFEFTALPAGSFNIEAAQLGFFSESTVVTVIEGSPSEVRFGLRAKPSDDSANEYTLEEESIVGEYQGDSAGDFNLSLAADAPTLTASLSRDDFEKNAVSDAGQAVGKIAGANIVDGKYAVVRGLADRYVSTTFNGGQISSADPSRKAVQLDLFPTGVIEAIKVDKTYSPWLIGDFGGGAIDIVTRAFPAERILSFKTKYTFNDEDDGEMLLHPGGDYDFLGTTRELMPTVLETRDSLGKVVFLDSNNTAPADLTERWRTLHDSQSFVPKEGKYQIGESYGFTYGDTAQINEIFKLGLITSLSQSSNDDNNDTLVSNPVFLKGFKREDYSRGVDTSAFLSTALSAGENHTIQATYFDKHTAKDTVTIGSRQNDGSNFGILTAGDVAFNAFGGDAVYYRGFTDISSTARDMKILQVKGAHKLSARGPSIDWSITESDASETRPYSTFMSYGQMDFSREALTPFIDQAYKNLYDTFLPDVLKELGSSLDPSITDWAGLRPVIVGIAGEDFARDAENAALPRIAPGNIGVVNTLDINGYTGSAEGRLRQQRRSDITKEQAYNQNAAITLPFYFEEDNDERLFELRGGASTFSKDRLVTSRVYDLTLRNDSNDTGFQNGALLSNGLAETLANNPDLISNYFNGTLIGGPYYGNFLGEAGVENLDTELRQSTWFMNGRMQWDKTFFSGGLRYEKEEYKVRFKAPPEVSAGLLAVLNDIEDNLSSRNPQEVYLPSATVGTSFFDDTLSCLVGWSKTTARPTFWEFVPTVSVDQAAGIGRRGNADLTNTAIDNMDLALTWQAMEKLTFRSSFFSKELERPLVTVFSANNEIIYRDSIEVGGVNQDFTADINGIELEAEVSSVGPFTLTSNFTYIDAILNYYQEGPVTAIPVSSALPFQPEYIANFTLTHEFEPWDLTTNLVYNLTSEYPTILKREPNDDEVLRQKMATYDLIVAKSLDLYDANYTFRVGIRNLLGARDRFMFGDKIFSNEDLGRTYYFEAEVSF